MRCTARSPTTSFRCCATPTSTWDEERQLDWAVRYWERAREAALPVAADFGDFWRDFEWMGVQRQLKVLGIFARLRIATASRLPRRHAARDALPARAPARATARSVRCSRCSTSSKASAPGSGTPSDGHHDRSARRRSACDGDDPRRRARRAHAAAVRCDAEAAAAGRRQAADRLADRALAPRASPTSSSTSRTSRRVDRARSATARARRATIRWSLEPEPLEDGRRHRHRDRAARARRDAGRQRRHLHRRTTTRRCCRAWRRCGPRRNRRTRTS